MIIDVFYRYEGILKDQIMNEDVSPFREKWSENIWDRLNVKESSDSKSFQEQLKTIEELFKEA